MTIGHRTTIALACALLTGALAAQGASAAGNGQTIFECSAAATTKEFSDAHCDNTGGTSFGHVRFPETATALTVTNGGTKNSTTEATTMVLKIALLRGFANVVVECSNVESTAANGLNSLVGGIHEGSGSGTLKFNNGAGILCKTNQAGCIGPTAVEGAKVALVNADAETVEGAALKEGGVVGGHGIKFFPVAPETKFTTIKFEGTCGLAIFPPFPVTGSAIATAGGAREGRGATAWFIEGEMNSLEVGGSPAQLSGKLTFKSTTAAHALILTTS